MPGTTTVRGMRPRSFVAAVLLAFALAMAVRALRQ